MRWSLSPLATAFLLGGIAPVGAAILSNVNDLSTIPHHASSAIAEVGGPLEAIRERLHVKEADGSIGIGVDAFERLWSRTRGQRWLAALARVPGLRQLGQLAYNVFARWLYRRNRAKGRW